jgi:hypothetical protein
MANYVLIKDGRVENIIVADESFIELVKDDYDAILDHDSFPEIAHIGGEAVQLENGNWVFGSNSSHGIDTFASNTGGFIDAEIVEPTLSIDAPAEEA